MVGCVLAVIAFVPFVALSYRRRGGLTFGRGVMWFGAAIYSMALWTFTLVPFPPAREVNCTAPQLHPFKFIDDIARHGVGSVSEMLHNPAFAQIALNVLLFMPLGWFIRHLGGRGIIVATLSGAVISGLIKSTQYTGVWGLYSCAYRVFDVDVLIVNTAGALIGSVIGLIAWKRDAVVDAHSPRPITVWRRVLGMLCDLAFVWFVGWISVAAQIGAILIEDRTGFGLPEAVFTIGYLALPLGIQLLVILTTGATVGEHIVLIRSMPSGRMPLVIARPLRFVFGIGGYWLLLQAPWPVTAWLSGLMFLVTVIMVFPTRRHRGLAGVASGLDVDDARRDAKSRQDDFARTP